MAVSTVDPVAAVPAAVEPGSGGVTLGASSWQIGARVASVGLQGAAFALVARLLGPDGLGAFAGAFALASLVGAASEFGLQNTTVVELGRDPEGRRATAARALVASALLGTAGVLLAAPIAVLAFDGDAGIAFAALVPWAVTSRLAVAGAAWFQHRLDFRRIFLVELVGRGVPVLGLAGLVAVRPAWSSTGLVVASGAVLAAGAVVQVLVACPRELWSAVRATQDRLAGALGLAKVAAPLGAAAAVSLVHVRADQILLELLGHGGAELGRYATSYRIVEGAAGVLGAVATVGFSAMSRADRADRPAIGHRSGRLVAAAAATGGLGVVVAAPALVAIVGGPGFGGAVGTTRLLAVIVSISVLNMGPSLTIVAERESRRLLPIGIGMVALNIGLNLVLVPIVGATGSAVATIASEALGLVLVMAVAERVLPGSQRPVAAAIAVGGVALAAVATVADPAIAVGTGLLAAAALVVTLVQARDAVVAR